MDCFLDTPCYNSHTVGVDSLWVGVPLVTMLRERGEGEEGWGEEVRRVRKAKRVKETQRNGRAAGFNAPANLMVLRTAPLALHSRSARLRTGCRIT